jgi:hypothetical protein
MVYPRIYHVYTRHMREDYIYMVYTRHIPGIFQAYTGNRGSRWTAEHLLATADMTDALAQHQ